MGAQAVRLSNVDINNALKNKDFEILFQPIFDLNNGALARFETFVRWRHASLGVLPPGAFISFFESQGRMSELTRYVLDEALTQYKAWRGPFAPGFSINLALSDLGDEAFASHFVVLLRDHEFPAELITLECPMPPVDQDVDQAQENFKRLSDTGARLAIEVRGRTNDFLRKIEPFPFDEIKTGGAAILRFARTVRGPGLSAISELLELAEEANAAITAVGVEDQASLSALRSLGFAAAQGNHLAKVGALTNFKPSHVNDVRDLLGLENLSADDLAALFRTSAPNADNEKAGDKKAAQSEAPEQADAEEKPKAKRPARKTPRKRPAPPAGDDELLERLAARIAENDNPDMIEKSLRLSRPSDRARKEAAIARAKEKAGGAKTADDENPAHDLQARLSEEFAAEEQKSEKDAETPAATEAADADAPESAAAADMPQSQPVDLEEQSKAADKTPAHKESNEAEAGAVDEIEEAPVSEPEADATEDEQAPADPADAESALEESGDDASREETAHTDEPTPENDVEDEAAPEVEAEQAPEPEPEPEIEPEIAAAAAIAATDQSQTPSPSEPAAGQMSKLSIGGAVARFLPVVQVASPEPIPVPAAPRDTVEVADPAHVRFRPSERATDKAQEKEPFTGDLDVNDDDFADIEEDALHENAQNQAETLDPPAIKTRKRKRRKKKNFLTRKYKLWPDHFWPKSWKRAWRRRAAYRAAAQRDAFE